MISLGKIELELLDSIHCNFVHEDILKIEFNGNKSCWVHFEGKIIHGYYEADGKVSWDKERRLKK
jgi:hypothetical protein